MVTVPKMIYKFNEIPLKNPTGIFAELYKLILKFIQKFKGLRIVKTKEVKTKEEQSWRTHTSLLQNLLPSNSNQDIVVLAKGYTDQWNRTESSKINPYIYVELIFIKDAKTIQWRKNNLFNKWW